MIKVPGRPVGRWIVRRGPFLLDFESRPSLFRNHSADLGLTAVPLEHHAVGYTVHTTSVLQNGLPDPPYMIHLYGQTNHSLVCVVFIN